MKFKEFLAEAKPKIIEIKDNKKLAEMLMENVNHEFLKTWANNDKKINYLFRGSSTTYKRTIVRTSINEKTPRKSANTSNEFTLLQSNLLPSWKDWPKRNQSFVCTNDFNRATDYSWGGAVYMVFPFNDPDIAICPAKDIWFSFKSLNHSDIDEFNDWLNQIRSYLYDEEKLKISDMDTINDLKEFIKCYNENLPLIEKFLNKKLTYQGIIDLKNAIGLPSLKSKDLLKTLNDVFDPNKNEFKKVKFSEFWKQKKLNTNPGHECWFSGTAIFLSAEFLGLNGKKGFDGPVKNIILKEL